MKMVIVLLFTGLLLIMCGTAIKIKKWLWIHQGLAKRSVDVDKYTNFMGIVDIIAGISCIIFGFMYYYFNISLNVILIMFITYCVFIIYGEVKYRIK